MRHKIALLPVAAAAVVLGALLLSSNGFGANLQTELASVSEIGLAAEGASLTPAISADGRYVGFASDAANIVTQDANSRDIFVRDRLLEASLLVSIASDGTQANAPASFPAISGDGRYVVFQSDASNLVAGDTNDAPDVFLHDRLTDATTRVSVAGNGAQGADASETPSVSADGRYVTFTSLAGNLVADDTNSDRDVFVRDLVAGTTELASVASDGTHGNFASGGLGAGPARVSGDGRYVVFGSFANSLVANDGNGRDDIFLRDRLAGTTERVSVASDEGEGDGHSMYGSVSDDGRFVAFFSDADNLVPDDSNTASDVFLRDRTLGVTSRLSVAPGGVQVAGPSRFPFISGDGGTIAFQSDASALVSGDLNGATDVFLYHVASDSIERASVADAGGEANGSSAFPALASDGATVVFQSTAGNLVPGDGNGVDDIFVRGKAAEGHPIGDANGDGEVNSVDAALILQYTAGLLASPPGGALSDANQDGGTDAIDAALVLQFSAGLLGRLPP